MKLILASILMLAVLHKSYSQDDDNSQKLRYDSNKIAIIPFAYREFFGALDSTNTAATLTQDDIDATEKIFLQSVAEHDSSLKGDDKKYYGVDLQKWFYRRQYVCYTTKQGDKIVYVDCFCAVFNDWHKQMVIVDDGGTCFFNVKINLTTKKWFDFMTGGYA